MTAHLLENARRVSYEAAVDSLTNAACELGEGAVEIGREIAEGAAEMAGLYDDDKLNHADYSNRFDLCDYFKQKEAE